MSKVDKFLEEKIKDSLMNTYKGCYNSRRSGESICIGSCKDCYMATLMAIDMMHQNIEDQQYHWIRRFRKETKSEYYVCSKCGKEEDKPYSYCNCGAPLGSNAIIDEIHKVRVRKESLDK